MQIVDLGGSWRVEQAGTREAFPAQVPGDIHADLLAAQRIDDPFYRDNEDALQWIGEVDWVYTRTFQVSEVLLQHAQVLLRCHGLDTLATIRLNGVEIARTDNMYRAWEFAVKEALVVGENTLEVTFASTIPYIEQRQQERPMSLWCGPKEVRGRSWVRKEPCSYGWDWGPVLATCGIWRPIELVAFNAARLIDVHIGQDHTTPGQVRLTVTPTVETVGDCAPITNVAVRLDGQVVSEASASGSSQLTLAIDDPQLWWPNQLGAQPLYTVEVTLAAADGTVLDTSRKRIGLRTLQLDRHPDAWGESFQFVVNGVPFFAKGGNWIPADALVTRLTRDDYARLLTSVADANMNMVRVWGGGIYEDDAFYDLCDELGLCVWQDFMFACAIYPAFDDAFLANVRAEAEQNVARLRHHPCIALWCGNNELEQGHIADAWDENHMSWEGYGILFDHLLADVVRRLDPQGSYWPCSPHSPHGDRKDFNNPSCGDAHLWDVWHGRKPFEWYRTCTHRFNSEFGFQSFPEPKTVRGYTAPQDRNVTTYVMEHHQRSGIGNAVIMQYMLDWFRLPMSFDMTLWLSQIQQGMAMKYAVEHWRRSMPRGMGTLYWQINDCWPVASWSSIDYHGRWKALQYMAKEFYAPLLVSGVEDVETGLVELHVTNDLREARAGTVRWTVTDIQGSPLARGEQTVVAAAGTNTLVTTADVSASLREHGARNLLLWLELVVDGAVVSRNFVSFCRPKHMELLDPQISTTATRRDDGTFVVTLEAQRPALWAWVSLTDADARYSDNFVHLMPGMPVSVVVTPQEELDAEAFAAQLRVCSLWDTYQDVAVPALV